MFRTPLPYNFQNRTTPRLDNLPGAFLETPKAFLETPKASLEFPKAFAETALVNSSFQMLDTPRSRSTDPLHLRSQEEGNRNTRR